MSDLFVGLLPGDFVVVVVLDEEAASSLEHVSPVVVGRVWNSCQVISFRVHPRMSPKLVHRKDKRTTRMSWFFWCEGVWAKQRSDNATAMNAYD